LKGGLEPACAKSCPTDSIQFDELSQLHDRARGRVEELHVKGVENAYLYGAPFTPGATGGLQQLNACFLLTAAPETYNLPRSPSRPAARVAASLGAGLATVASLTRRFRGAYYNAATAPPRQAP
jgi:formate dehydrogenase iron-sulfur subunit